MAAGGQRSDLAVRTGSAIVMLVVAGLALWFGGLAFQIFAVLLAGLVFWEWSGIVLRFPNGAAAKIIWLLAGAAYIALAVAALLFMSTPERLTVIGLVIATDIGAYFAGRTIGGPKIAPAISPSKTWAGLGGGMVAAGLLMIGIMTVMLDAGYPALGAAISFAFGAVVAIVAQVGDFFESWMKRRAGVKDSGRLIPGHGGVFDRVDGLLLAAIATALVGAASGGLG